MKNFLFLCGPNGIGKTTVSMEIINRLPRSAYVDSDSCRVMNPFVLEDDTIPTISKNISDLIYNYWNCPLVGSEEENIRRMKLDHRSQERMERAVEESGKAFDNVTYLKIDVTELTAEEAAKTVLLQVIGILF